MSARTNALIGPGRLSTYNRISFFPLRHYGNDTATDRVREIEPPYPLIYIREACFSIRLSTE